MVVKLSEPIEDGKNNVTHVSVTPDVYRESCKT